MGILSKIGSFLGGILAPPAPTAPSWSDKLGEALSQGLLGGIQSGLGERVGTAIGGSPAGFMAGSGPAYAAQAGQTAYRNQAQGQHESYLTAQEKAATTGQEFQTGLMDKQFRQNLQQQVMQQNHEMAMLDKQLGYANPQQSGPETFAEYMRGLKRGSLPPGGTGIQAIDRANPLRDYSPNEASHWMLQNFPN